jgi:hypothetical protein
MPKRLSLEIPPEEQAQLLAALRRARYGSLLALHRLLLCAVRRTPRVIAAVLCCSRARVYRAGRASQEGTLDCEHEAQGRLVPPVRPTVLLPTLRRSRRALLKAPPRASGWCRPRWSGAPLALTRQAQRRLTVSAQTRRRGLHERGWVWPRAHLVAKDDDPQRVNRLARLRWVCAQRKRAEAMVVANDLASPLVPNVGCAWMPQGTQVEGMTPGQHATHDLAGALDPTTGTLPHGLGVRKTTALVRDLRSRLAERDPAERYTRLSGVVDH